MSAEADGAPRTERPSDPPTRRLTRLYVAALTIVALLTIAGQILTQISLTRQLDDSRVINLAGRQRMLSQRLTQLALRIDRSSASDRERAIDDYATAYSSWVATQEGLRHGSAELELPANDSVVIERMFDELDESYLPMRDAAATVLASLKEPADEAIESRRIAVDAWLADESRYLAGMDAIVFQYDAEARQRVARLRLIEAALLIATLLTLTAEGLFVFRPAVARLGAYVRQIQSVNADLAAAERRAVEADGAKTQFLAGMSHELRTPMNAILGASELALERSDDPSDRKLLSAVHGSAKSLLSMLNDLLDLSRFDAGAPLTLQVEAFDVRDAIGETAELFRPSAERKGLTLDCRVAPNVPQALAGDVDRLRQILTNLVSNAIKFTDAGAVEILATVDKDSSATDGGVTLRIDVVDSGVGIAPEHARRIFERFTQVDPSLRRRAGGAGLGLAISAELTRAMGGSIELDSTPGRGSRFSVRILFAVATIPEGADDDASRSDLPSKRNHSARTVGPRSASSAPDHASPRALVVDDSEANRLILTERLSGFGYVVVEAANGREAILAAKGSAFDVILMDLEMPEMDGLAAARELRALRIAETEVAPRLVAVTAHAWDRIAVDCMEAGFDGLLEKPVDREALFDALRSNGRSSDGGTSVEIAIAEPPTVADIDDEPTAAIRRRFAGRDPLLRSLISLYRGERHSLASRLASSIASDDRVETSKALHRWKGTCANFGWNGVTDEFLEAERRLTEGGPLDHVVSSELRDAIATLEQALDAIELDRDVSGRGARSTAV